LKGTHLGSGLVSSDRAKDGETARRECYDFGRTIGVYGLGGRGDNGDEGDGELHVSTEPRDQYYEVPIV
jgi:hypothetical protein